MVLNCYTLLGIVTDIWLLKVKINQCVNLSWLSVNHWGSDPSPFRRAYFSGPVPETQVTLLNMNIFLLDNNIQRCARFHCDLHVIKMLLEGTQILCSVSHLNKIITPYKPTHLKHPSVIWAGKSFQNWLWLKTLVFELNKEYRYRYDSSKDHKSYEVAKNLEIPPLPALGLLEHPQVMPEKYKVLGDPVKAYRKFYIHEKTKFATWRKRKIPHWCKIVPESES